MLDWLWIAGQQALRMSLQHAQYLLGFAAVFILIETLWPSVPSQRRWRSGSGIDLALSFLNPLIVWPITVFIVAAIINWLLAAIGWETHRLLRDSLAAQPYWLQFALAMLVADFFSYWKHRVFHMHWLWPIHAVHHASAEVDWLTNERDHPLQLAGTYFFVLTGLALAGFSNEMIATQAIIRRAFSLYTHANVAWHHGPLARVLVSPAMHRWHHASDEQVIDRNFATMFSFFDVLFGTYAMPSGQPRTFGVPGEPPPATLRAALAHPVRVLRQRKWGANGGAFRRAERRA